MKRWLSCLGSLCLLSSCVSEVSAPANDPSSLVTVSQGVYGVVVSGCDEPGCHPSFRPGKAINLHLVRPTSETSPPAFASTQTDSDGFYEFGLPVGTYWLCLDWRPAYAWSFMCVRIDVEQNQLLRRDYCSRQGEGWSPDWEHCPPPPVGEEDGPMTCR